MHDVDALALQTRKDPLADYTGAMIAPAAGAQGAAQLALDLASQAACAEEDVFSGQKRFESANGVIYQALYSRCVGTYQVNTMGAFLQDPAAMCEQRVYSETYTQSDELVGVAGSVDSVHLVDPSTVRRSKPLQFRSAPTFNFAKDDAGGDGRLCTDTGKAKDCFTFADGTLASEAAVGLPAAYIVKLTDPAVKQVSGCNDCVTWAFGNAPTQQPTVRKPAFKSSPTDTLTIDPFRVVVFAYKPALPAGWPSEQFVTYATGFYSGLGSKSSTVAFARFETFLPGDKACNAAFLGTLETDTPVVLNGDSAAFSESRFNLGIFPSPCLVTGIKARFCCPGANGLPVPGCASATTANDGRFQLKRAARIAPAASRPHGRGYCLEETLHAFT